MTFNFSDSIPASGNNPSVDQPTMLTNNISAKAIIDIDHVGYDQPLGGYHRYIHQKEQSPATPAAIATVNQLYSRLYTPDTTGGVADTQLFARTGGGGISQITGYSTQNTQDGWQWVGGILIQWGFVNTTSTGTFASGLATGTVTFKDRVAGAIPFPNNCFVVIPVPTYNTNITTGPTGAGSTNVDKFTVSATKFDWTFNSVSTRYRGFYWTAIGN